MNRPTHYSSRPAPLPAYAVFAEIVGMVGLSAGIILLAGMVGYLLLSGGPNP